MANQPQQFSAKLESAKGGALAWIAYEAGRGRPVTCERFIEQFSGPFWDAQYGQDLLDELTWVDAQGRRLVEMHEGGILGITEHALEWIDRGDWWRHLFQQIAADE